VADTDQFYFGFMLKAISYVVLTITGKFYWKESCELTQLVYRSSYYK